MNVFFVLQKIITFFNSMQWDNEVHFCNRTLSHENQSLSHKSRGKTLIFSLPHTHTFTRPYRNYIANNVHISTLSLIKVHSSIHSTYPSLIHLSNSSSHPTNHPSFIHPFHQPTHQPVIYPLIQPSSNPSAHRFRYNSFSQFVLAIRHKKNTLFYAASQTISVCFWHHHFVGIQFWLLSPC